MKNRPLVAIDIGSTKIACVVATGPAPLAAMESYGLFQRGGRDFEIVGVGLVEYPSQASTWPCDSNVLARAIEQALEATGVTQPLQDAVVALSHPQLLHTRVTARIDLASEPVTIHRRHLRRLDEQALSQALGIDWDPLLLQPLGYSGNGFDAVRDPRTLVATRLSGTFQLIGIPLAVRRVVTQALEAVGLEVEQLRYSLQAVAVSCVEESIRSKRALLMDIGGCCTDLAILDQGHLARTMTIPWGGSIAAHTIAQECKVTWKEALAMSLEGPSSAKPKVRQIMAKQLMVLQKAAHELLRGEALPDHAVVTGRGALIDGVVEWVEMMSEVKSVLGRSPRASTFGDLSSQVGLSPVLGLLELAFRPSVGSPFSFSRGELVQRTPSHPARLVDRLIDRTRRILVEYF